MDRLIVQPECWAGNYKSLLVWLFLLFGIIQTLAGPRDFLQAQKIAQQKAATLGASISEQNIQLTRSKSCVGVTPQQTTPYYIFNFDDSTGYAIVGGDDRMPAIVGYSNKGMLNPDSLPANLKSFLAAYTATVEAVENGDTAAVKNVKAAMKRVAGSFAPIAPLLGGIVWSQDAPFNNLCPKYDGKHNAVTGCVATAVAQIMRYWKYPSSLLTGIPAYVSKRNNIPMDSIQMGIEYDWDNMLENYNGKYTDNQAFAVATLMLHVGSSVQMKYGRTSAASSSDVAPALTKYFGYDKNLIKTYDRSYFEWEDWNRILQDELGKKRPVYYSGTSSSAAHAFVCDGMDSDGYYHINWGWGGMSNDYFDITILNPNDKGIGGGDSSEGFSSANHMVIGIVPDTAQDKLPSFEYDRIFVEGINDKVNNYREKETDCFHIKAKCILSNKSHNNIKALFTIGMKDSLGNIMPITAEYTTVSLAANKSELIEIGYDYAFPIGEYFLYVMQSEDNGKTWNVCYGHKDNICITEHRWYNGRFDYVTVGNIYYELDNLTKEATVIKYIADQELEENLSFPETVTKDGELFTVTTIGNSAFEGNSTIESITLPKTIEKTDTAAFFRCKKLKTVIFSPDSKLKVIGLSCFNSTAIETIEIPATVERIEDAVFSNTKLKKIKFASEAKLKYIGSQCFNETDIETIELPEGITDLGKLGNINEGWNPIGCFHQCDKLKSIYIPKTVKNIGCGCFWGCDNLKEVYIPEDSQLEVVSFSAFENCSSLERIEFPSTLKELLGFVYDGIINLPDNTIINKAVKGSTFSGCVKLKKVSFNKDSQLKYLPSQCFGHCGSLTDVELPDNLEILGASAFEWCFSLKYLRLPEKLEVIGNRCFWRNETLTHIELPSSLKEIGCWGFYECKSLQGKILVSEGVEKIGIEAFCRTKIQELFLPGTLKKIERNCFWECNNLEKVVVGEGVEVLDTCCFEGCTKISSITLPKSLRKIGRYSFSNCFDNADVVIPEGVEELEVGCFSKANLASVRLPGTLRKISEDCFEYCKNMKEVTISKGVEELPERCFFGCINVSHISIPSTLRNFGKQCFAECSNWEEKVIVPEGVAELPYGCFDGCKKLKEIVLPSTIRKLGSYCFNGCESLVGTFVIPEGVTILPEHCFSDCSKLESVILPSTINTYNLYWIDGNNPKLQSIYLYAKEVPSSDDGNVEFFWWNTCNAILYVPEASLQNYKEKAANNYFVKDILPIESTGIDDVTLSNLKISVNGGVLEISGLQEGLKINIHSLDGKYIGDCTVSNGVATFYCTELMIIAKIGNKSIKIATNKTL